MERYGKDYIFKKIESEGEIILIREKIRDEMRDLGKDRSEINWDKVADVYGLKELIKNIKF
jgi:hypothetical protein